MDTHPSLGTRTEFAHGTPFLPQDRGLPKAQAKAKAKANAKAKKKVARTSKEEMRKEFRRGTSKAYDCARAKALKEGKSDDEVHQ